MFYFNYNTDLMYYLITLDETKPIAYNFNSTIKSFLKYEGVSCWRLSIFFPSLLDGDYADMTRKIYLLSCAGDKSLWCGGCGFPEDNI